MGAPFVLVTLLRRVIDLKRPYEVYGFYEEPPKDKKGRSFPSRHAFSAFSIGTLALRFLPIAGASVLFCGVLLSVSRVLLGKHFPRDVIAGALIGIATSVLGMLPIILI
jgi:membrane-associated phospholipid phosphatase